MTAIWLLSYINFYESSEQKDHENCVYFHTVDNINITWAGTRPQAKDSSKNL